MIALRPELAARPFTGLPAVRGRLTANAPIGRHTWFGAGGAAQMLFRPAGREDLAGFLGALPSEIAVTVIGGGANLLVRDGGIPGVTIRLGRSFAGLASDGAEIVAGAAALHLNVAAAAAEAGISGLEFLCGVPGTMGGGLRMNAGAYGREISDVMVSAAALDRGGAFRVIDCPAMGFSYRHCAVDPDWIFIEARLRGTAGNRGSIARRMAEIRQMREASQPIRARTGGSTFRNPPGDSAWRLIDAAGCRGLARGGAMVSAKHANFLVNTGAATAADLEGVGEEVRRRVYEMSGIVLEWEIRRVGHPLPGIEPVAEGVPEAVSKTVALLMGGWSPEREVSLSSGRECAEALADHGYQVKAIDVGRDLPALLRALDPRPDVIFNALHGVGGEDGTVQAVCEMLAIPYTHSGVLASALAMHKPTAKAIFRAAGLPVVESILACPEDLARHDPLPAPFVAKPINQGSSVGVRIVRVGDNSWREEVLGWRFGSQIMIERFIPGRELTVAVMGECALGVCEIVPRGSFYDYTAKYAEGGSDHLVPAPIPARAYEEALDIGIRAHRVLGCRGVSRADLRYDDTAEGGGRLYLLEVNTQPGMTPTSLVPDIARHAGIGFDELVVWIIENAACDG